MKHLKYSSLLLSLLAAACAVPVVDGTGRTVAVAPAVVINAGRADSTAPVHVCTLKPFTTTYRSENASRGRARLDVQKQCRANHSAMFCEDKDVVCTSYH